MATVHAVPQGAPEPTAPTAGGPSPRPWRASVWSTGPRHRRRYVWLPVRAAKARDTVGPAKAEGVRGWTAHQILERHGR